MLLCRQTGATVGPPCRDRRHCAGSSPPRFRRTAAAHTPPPFWRQASREPVDGAARHRCAHNWTTPSGQRFWDILVDGTRISLKSSGAKDLREDVLHISKLTEAAWIQDCRSARVRRDHTRELFERYCSEVDAIFQLRYFQGKFRYELVEIPVSLFRQVLDVGASHYAADGPTISIPIGRVPPDFTLRLDR